MTDKNRLGDGRLHLLLGVVAMVLALATVGFVIANASLQKAAAAGQERIASAQAAANVNNSLIQMLAKSATENNDPALKALLAENGITVSEANAATPATPQQAAPANPGR